MKRRARVGVAVHLALAMMAALLCASASAQQIASSSPPAKGDLGANYITVTPVLARERNLGAWEDPKLKHGLFTYWVIHGLTGGAKDANEHAVTVLSLYNLVHDNVREAAARLQRRQEPLYSPLLDSNPAIAWP